MDADEQLRQAEPGLGDAHGDLNSLGRHKPDRREVGFDINAGDLTVHDGRLWHRVQKSPFIGEKSRRRVMYVPVVTGKYQPKDKNSKTPFYHRLASTVQN